MVCYFRQHYFVHQLSLQISDVITGHMQAASSTTVDQVLNKPWREASRKKAHWDFVLEEMTWMANDFVQVPYFLPAWGLMGLLCILGLPIQMLAPVWIFNIWKVAMTLDSDVFLQPWSGLSCK